MRSVRTITLAVIVAIILLTAIIYIFTSNGCHNKRNLLSQIDNTKNIELYNIENDSSYIVGYTEQYNLESNIKKYKIILNDSICILTTQDSNEIWSDTYKLFSLKKEVADYLRLLLCELYSKHNTMLLDSVPRFKYRKDTAMPYWSVKLKLNDTLIQETIPYEEYVTTEWHNKNDNIELFYDEFIRYWAIINAIISKIDNDVYNHQSYIKSKKWIAEMFHDEYYEPYNDINSNRYR